MKVSFMLPVAALLVGAALGYTLAPLSNDANAEAPIEKAKPSKGGAITDNGDKASIAALRARVAELEQQLVNTNQMVATREERRERRERNINPQERMENLRKENPERYAQVTNWLARMRRNFEEHSQNTMAILASVNTSGMSAKARKTHEEYRALMQQRDDLVNQMQQENLGAEERREIDRQLFENNRNLTQLGAEERKNLLTATAKAYGIEGAEAEELMSDVRAVYDATEGNGWMRPQRGGRGRGPRRQ